MSLAETPLFKIPWDTAHHFTWKGLILLLGGLFLIGKSTTEIHHKLEGHKEETKGSKAVTFGSVLFQILLVDLVFSVDSILTAVGLVEHLIVMIIAVIISIIVMMAFAGTISRFINKHPTLQMLALSFLILIGFMLVGESFHFEIPKGFIYFAIFFSLIVEILNMRLRRKSSPVELRTRLPEDDTNSSE